MAVENPLTRIWHVKEKFRSALNSLAIHISLLFQSLMALDSFNLLFRKDMRNKVFDQLLTKILFSCFVMFTLASCEKDEKGYFLSPNYCTATINGKDYIDRESYTIPLWGHSPRAELYRDDFYIGNEVIDITPVLIIHSRLEPAKGNNDSLEYSLDLYIKSFNVGNPLDGQTYSFSYTPALDNLLYTPLDSIFKSMWKEDINVALVSSSGDIFEYAPYNSASGTIQFHGHEGENESLEGGGDFEADITLATNGENPIQFKGYMYTAL